MTVLARQPRQVDARHELSSAERHIAAMEERLGRQMRRTSTLAATGQDTAAAEGLLRVMEQSLALMYEHREMIRQELAAEEGELGAR